MIDWFTSAKLTVNKSMMIAVILIAIFFAILMAIAIVMVTHRNNMKKEALKCSQEARQFHMKVMLLSSPSRLFTDDELRQLKMEVSPLLKRVNKLYNSKFVSKEYLDDLGLNDFVEERMHLNHLQYINNKTHQS